MPLCSNQIPADQASASLVILPCHPIHLSQTLCPATPFVLHEYPCVFVCIHVYPHVSMCIHPCMSMCSHCRGAAVLVCCAVPGLHLPPPQQRPARPIICHGQAGSAVHLPDSSPGDSTQQSHTGMGAGETTAEVTGTFSGWFLLSTGWQCVCEQQLLN